MSDCEWAKPQADDKRVVLQHCPRARLKRFPGRHVSFTVYLNRDPSKRETAHFWAPDEKTAWAEARADIEYAEKRKEAEIDAR